MSDVSGQAEYSVSRDGSLLYAPGRAWGLDNRVVWVDREGRAQPLLDVGGRWQDLRISPDGRRLAFHGDAAVIRVWVYDIERSALSRLPFDGINGQPIWTPDGRHVAFWGGDGQSGTFGTFLQLADGSQPAERLTTMGFGNIGWRPRFFSPDGTILALETQRPRQDGIRTYFA